MLKRVAFGPLAPDLPPSDAVEEAENVIPHPNGYGPVGSFQALTPVLAGFRGGAAFLASDGLSSFLSGTATDLWRYSSGAWASVLGSLTATRWRFAQFGDNVIATNGAAPVSYDLSSGTAAALAGSPPVSDMVTTVRDFVVVAGDPALRQRVTWSGLNDSTEWTPTENQSDFQDLPDGGEIMGLAGGEYGIVLQRNAIKRMSYEGEPIVFRFDEISANIGCMSKGSVAQAGRLVFFLSERGFMQCDGNDAKPIGTERIDRTFFKSYAREEIENNLYAAIDPRRFQVVWSMPGRPGTAWVYNWILDRWTTINTSLKGVFSGFTANVSLEGVDTLYPGGIDTVPVSLDDPIFAGGNPLFLVCNADDVIGTLSGSNLAASITLADMEVEPGRVRVRRCRPITDAEAVNVSINGRPRAGAPNDVKAAGSMRRNGDVPIRVNARIMNTTIAIPAAEVWTYLQGIDFEYESAGTR